jgi:hypothetical protein
MHTLSTEFNLRKLQCVWVLTIFHLFQINFHQYLRLPFPLPMTLQDSYSSDSLRNIAGARFWEPLDAPIR